MRSLNVVSDTTFSNFSPGMKPRGWSHGTTSSSSLVLQGKGQGLCDWPPVREMPAFCKPTVQSLTCSSWGSEERCRPPLGTLLQFSVLGVQDLDSWRRETICDLQSEKFHSGS